MTKSLITAVIALMVLFSCGSPEHALYVFNYGWPASTSISVIQGGEITVRTSLYGRHARIVIPGDRPFRIRAASPAVLTFVSREINEAEEMATFSLPRPVFRRTIGRYRLGADLRSADADTIASNLIASAASSFTTLSMEFHDKSAEKLTLYREFVGKAHNAGIEVIACVNVQSWNTQEDRLANTFSMVHFAEICGIDGIVINDEFLGKSPGGFILRQIRSIAGSVHRRGMTLSMEITADRQEFMARMFIDIPVSRCPDELRLNLDIPHESKNGEIVSPVSVERIESAIVACFDHAIPLSKLSIDMNIQARAFINSDNDVIAREDVSPGELQDVLVRAGEQAQVRLWDGSLRLGYSGTVYAYEDGKGLAEKIGKLLPGSFKRMRGVYIVSDGSGLSPDSEMMCYLAESLQ